MANLRLRKFVSERLRDLRVEETSYTQDELARRAGVSVDVVGKIERAETTPSLETLSSLCQSIRIPMSEFFGPEEEVADKSPADKLHRYLTRKRPEHIEIADGLVRTFIKHLEVERMKGD